MKKKINLKVLSFAVIFFAVIMLSCSTEENSNSNETKFSSMNEMILVKSSTKRVTSQFADLGVSKINIKKDDSFLSRIGNESTEVTFEDVKPFYIDKNLIHFSDYTFVISGDKFILNENNSFYLSVENGDLYLNTPDKKLNVMLENDYSFEKESSLLILAFNELTSKESRLNGVSGNGRRYPAPCGFWDKYEVVSLGFTGYESQMNNYNATHGSGALGAGCRSMGPTTTSCMFDNHVCATTKSFCCD